MVIVFSGQTVGQQTGSSHAALNRALGGAGLADAVALHAIVFGTHVTDDFKAAWLVLQNFRDVLLNGSQLTAAAQTSAIGTVVVLMDHRSIQRR